LDEASKNKGNELISSERRKEVPTLKVYGLEVMSFICNSNLQIVLADFVNWAKNLEGEAFDKLEGMIIECKKNIEKETNNNQLCRKIKIEKQLYYPKK
jgi:hypothetical protein